MDLGLKDKVAVVAASSKGLGKGVAEAFAREGARLALCSRNEEGIAETGAFLEKSYGVEVLSLVCDVTSREQVKRFRKRVLDAFGTVHVLFTNAGGPPPGGVLDLDPPDYEKALELNLMSTLDLVYAFLPAMKEQKWGRVIASTSITVKQPLPMLALSNVSRAGVIAFVKSLAQAVAPFNITANSLAPGYIMTERVRALLEGRMEKERITFEEALRDVVQQIPAGRTGTPEEFGAAAAFLASEQAAFINGETLLVDGGMYRGLM
jgi:3-oxoacyl-[acyl-carrier protein] reductase